MYVHVYLYVCVYRVYLVYIVYIVYIVDVRVYLYVVRLLLLLIIGDQTTITSNIDNVSGIAVDSAGNVYITDNVSEFIYLFIVLLYNLFSPSLLFSPILYPLLLSFSSCLLFSPSLLISFSPILS